MFIDPKIIVTNLKGEAMKINTDDKQSPDDLTLGYVVITALTINIADDKPDKAAWVDDFMLAERFEGATGPVKLDSKEVERIKNCVVRLPFNKLAVSRSLMLLNNLPTKLPEVATVPANDAGAANAA